MLRALVHIAVAGSAAVAGFHAAARPLSAAERHQIRSAHMWHPGCPVSLSQLRLLTVSYRGFDDRTHTGRLVVNEKAVVPVRQALHRLYDLDFPIRHMGFLELYGPASAWPADGDVTGSFECREAAASPCTGSTATTGTWSEHAYGEAVDVNPVENPYVGCGMVRNKVAVSYMNRARVRRGMVTPSVVAAFRAGGWGWGGAWSGSTKDYMHFSATGH